MKKTICIIGTLIALTLVGALIRFVNAAGIGAGGGKDSPDKAFLAEAMSFEGEKFWGGKYSYYEFTVKTSDGQRICHYTIPDPPEPLSDWREESSQLIQWATNSSSVSYNFDGGQLILRVIP